MVVVHVTDVTGGTCNDLSTDNTNRMHNFQSLYATVVAIQARLAGHPLFERLCTLSSAAYILPFLLQHSQFQ